MRVSVIGAAVVIAGVLEFGCSGSKAPSKPSSETPLAVLSIDSAVAIPGTVAGLNVRLDWPNGTEPDLDSLGGFELLICYNASSLRFMHLVKYDSAISKWEYVTYRTGRTIRTESDTLGTIQFAAYRNLDNNVDPSPPQFKPTGSLARLEFMVSDDFARIGTSPVVGFAITDCRDNTMFPEGNQNQLYTPNTALGRIAFGTGFDTMGCPRRYELSPVLELVGGWVRIAAPVDDRPRRGDMNLDGTPNGITDAVLFGQYFHRGYSVFDPLWAALQIANSDYDGDLVPLTVTDMDSLVRIINSGTNGFIPDSSYIPYQDTLWIMPRRTDANKWILACRSTTQIDEMWMRIESPIDRGDVRYLGDSTVTVSVQQGLQIDSPPAVYTWFVSCGTTGPQTSFSPELGDRLEIRTANGELNIRSAQASRYPGVSITVVVVRSS